MEGMGSDIHPCVGETSLKALQSCLGLRLALLGLMATPNSPIGRYNPPPASHATCPLYPPHPLIRAIHDITVVVKKVAQNPVVLASYYR